MPSPIPPLSKPPGIITYHCLCTQLLLATPYSLSTLPRRSHIPPSPSPSNPPPLTPATHTSKPDIILPLGRPPNPNPTPNPPPETTADADPEQEQEQGGIGYSLLLNTTLDRKPVIVRREDGFEKRWVRRCGRCRVGMGYVLDLEGGGEGGKKEGGERVVYLFEGGLRETGEL